MSMTLDPSRPSRFGTCSCRPVPSDRPLSIKQLHGGPSSALCVRGAQSSACRTTRSPRRSNSWSNSSSTILLRNGDRGPPCGVPSSTGLARPCALHHPSREKRSDQPQQPPVADPYGDPCHQFVVRNPIEEFLQVKIYAPAIAFGHILLCRFDRLMGRPPRTKPVAVFGKRPVPFALQNRHHRLQEKSAQHRRDAKLAHPSVRLRELHPLHRMGPIVSIPEQFPDRCPALFQVCANSWTRTPSAPTLPLLALTRANACLQFSRSQTFSVNCLPLAGLLSRASPQAIRSLPRIPSELHSYSLP
jgi:hypothetical protein